MYIFVLNRFLAVELCCWRVCKIYALIGAAKFPPKLCFTLAKTGYYQSFIVLSQLGKMTSCFNLHFPSDVENLCNTFISHLFFFVCDLFLNIYCPWFYIVFLYWFIGYLYSLYICVLLIFVANVLLVFIFILTVLYMLSYSNCNFVLFF